MRITHRSAAAVLVGATLITGTAVLAPSAEAAALSHHARARADWIKGSKVAAAVEGKYWRAASRELAHYGARYRTERHALGVLLTIPLTDTTNQQRIDAVKYTRVLNASFHTPGLYGVKPAASHRAKAKADWVKSFSVSAAEQNRYLTAARRQLARYGTKYAAQIRQIKDLEAIPLTSTTAQQRAEAHRLLRALNAFFGTHFD